jgi:hypothetical protein
MALSGGTVVAKETPLSHGQQARIRRLWRRHWREYWQWSAEWKRLRHPMPYEALSRRERPIRPHFASLDDCSLFVLTFRTGTAALQ